MRKYKIAYWVVTALLIADLILTYQFSISLAGSFSDKALFWGWLILTFIIVGINVKEKWAKIYAAILALIVFLSMLPMMIPFLYMIGFAFGQSRRNYQLDSNYRVQENLSVGPVAPKIQLIKRMGILEKVIGDTPFQFEINREFYRIEGVKKISIVSIDENKVKIEFEFGPGKVTREFEQR